MKLKFLLSLIFTTMFAFIVKSQETLPIYTDYLTDNYYLVHPSMAGASNCSKVRLTGRKLWLGQENSPGLMTLNGHTRIGQSNSGIGAIFFTDGNGFHEQTGMSVTYAHHIMFSRTRADLNMLSFGLSGGFIQYRLDQTSFFNEGFDPAILGIEQSATNFNVDFGFSYHFLDFYMHATAKNLVSNAGINTNQEITSNVRRYLFSIGGVLSKYSSEWSFEPSLMYQFRELTGESTLDLNFKTYKELDFGKIWAGLSYRVSLDAAEFIDINGEDFTQRLQQITPIIGMNINKFMFAYNYTYENSELVFANSGFHQITLGFDFNCSKEPYDCKCPAVN